MSGLPDVRSADAPLNAKAKNMSALQFRPATYIERLGVIRNQWLAQVLPRGSESKDGRHRTGRPGATLSTWAARQALELLVEHLLEGLSDVGTKPNGDRDFAVTVLVAELDDVPGELLGWVAFTPDDAIHFIRVPSGYGRRGLATELLRRAGADLAHSWLTPNGRAFASAVLDKPG